MRNRDVRIALDDFSQSRHTPPQASAGIPSQQKLWSPRYENHRVCMRAQRKSLISFPASLSRVCSSEKRSTHVPTRPTITVSIHMLSGSRQLNIYKDGEQRNDRKTGKYLSNFKSGTEALREWMLLPLTGYRNLDWVISACLQKPLESDSSDSF